MTKTEIKQRIRDAFAQHAQVVGGAFNAIPRKTTKGKLYEAWVLAHVLEQLANREGLSAILTAGNVLRMRSSPGPIDPRFPHIGLYRNSTLFGEIWTDVEWSTLSYEHSRRTTPNASDLHELDIVCVEPLIRGYPRFDQIWFGIECKNTPYKKNLLREILGVRRELSYLNRPLPTRFQIWPRRTVPAMPPSCLAVFSTHNGITRLGHNPDTFGIDFIHFQM